MHQALVAYLLAFVQAFWPNLTRYQRHEVKTIVADIASTNGTPLEDLTLVNIAALESNFDTHAKGDHGRSHGAFQVSDDGGKNHDYSAREALRRMRTQGMVGYVGCRHLEDHVVLSTGPTTCVEMIAHRTDRALLFLFGNDPPSASDEPPSAVAGNP
jgi:hypothetical protein